MIPESPEREGMKPAVMPALKPKEVTVEVDGRGEPTRIVIRGRRRTVLQVQNRWRIDDKWWRQEISRLYYQLVLTDGSLLTVFQDLHSGRWFEQRYWPVASPQVTARSGG